MSQRSRVLIGVVLPIAIAAAIALLAAEPPAPPPAPLPLPLPAAPPAPPPPTSAQKAEEYYKNIQSLTGTPADQLVPAMQFISAALGVDCEHCHVERAPEKDDKKEKQTARKMIAMTRALNRDSFEGRREVTCNSCHRGATHPAATPAVATGEPEPEAEEGKGAPLPAAEAILDKYLQAVGGAEALGKISSRVQRGKMIGAAGQPLPVEVFAKAPDLRASVVRTPRGDNVTAFDGRGGWLGSPGRPARDMSAAESDAARLDAELRFAARVKGLFGKFRVVPGNKIEGKDAIGVVADNDGRPPVELWFDAQSGLLVRQVRYAETPLGRNPTQIDYGDYRDADGVKVPFRWSVARPSGRFVIEIEETLQNVPIDDARFRKPPAS